MSSSKRPQILMSILLVLVLGYLVVPKWQQYVARSAYEKQHNVPPLPGENSITALQVKSNDKGRWVADFDYFYTGQPLGAALKVDLVSASASTPDAVRSNYVPVRIERGRHHASVELAYPGRSGQTTQIIARMSTFSGTDAASEQIAQTITWPEFSEWIRERELSTKTPQELLARAVELIDSQNDASMVEAKTILERLIAKDPRFDAAYVELARVAMKTNWGTEGLHQAESLLSSALQIDPQSANAKILMGYVYVHQERYAQAESLFADAARSNPPNLWLWANWGELLARQGKLDQATLKYREAVTRPRPQGTYDRARLDALNHLVMLFEKRNDIDGTEAMMKQREEEYGPGRCFSTDYARFLLEKRGDVAASIKVSSQVVGTTCSREKEARQVLGMGYYMNWAGATGAQRNEALNQARVYLPAGPMPLYLLAASDVTLPAAKQLIAAGEKIDQTDNEGFNALAYALQHEDLAVAKRLLQLGAKPDAMVGFGQMPVALMAVMSGNVEAIRLMQQYGADYRKLRYQGTTAFDVAKGSGDNALLEVLNHKVPVL